MKYCNRRIKAASLIAQATMQDNQIKKSLQEIKKTTMYGNVRITSGDIVGAKKTAVSVLQRELQKENGNGHGCL